MRARIRLRSVAVAVTVAVVAAMVSTPAASAAPDTAGDPPAGATSDGGVRLTPAQLEALSEKYAPQSDGTPGLVAQASGDAEESAGPTAKLGATSKNDTDVDGFVSKGSVETVRGAVSTLALAGTLDWVGISSAGTVARYDAQGHIVWQDGVHDLSAAWDITPASPVHTEDLTPQFYEGFNPYQPGTTGRHPFAQADFNRDGTADVAVAYQLGVSPDAPFTTPGSDLHSGTFVSVFDGRTGTMLWHHLIPGTVGSMMVQSGTLIVAENTGPDWDYNPVAEQGDSRSALVGYRFSGSGHTSLTGSKAWTYSTKAPWADWTDVENVGSGQVTAGWTDTPMGLGNPRPPAGHVVVVDAKTGKGVLDVKTPGYPRIVQADVIGGRLLVAEQNDPTDRVEWSLTRIDLRSGARSVVMTHDGAVPEAVEVNSLVGAAVGQPQYVVSELGINADLTDGAYSVLGLDRVGRTTWTYTTTSTVGAPESPVTGVVLDPLGQVLVTVSDGVQQTLKTPEGPYHTQLVALSSRTGKVAWKHEGGVAGDQVTAYLGGYLTVGYDLTAWQTSRLGKSVARPLLGDLYAADAADVNGDGVQDLIVGGQSHGVFALDGKALKADKIKVLWETPVTSGVHAIHVAAVADSRGRSTSRVVAATSDGFAVLDPKRGTLVSQTTTGAFQYDTPVIDGRVVASGSFGVRAYDAVGRIVWTYQPATAAGKDIAYSVPATDGNGRIFLEYGGVRTAFGSGLSDPAPTGVALDAAKGTELWTIQPEASAKAVWVEAQAGVYASSDIPGADGHGVVFTFGGDKPGTSGHTALIVDGRTGAAVSQLTAAGSATFEGYASSADQGLLWLHTILATVLPADGSDPYLARANSYLQNGVVATAQDGSEMLVAGTGGVLAYSLPFPNKPDQYQYGDASAFAYFAGHVTALPLDKDKATDIVALQQDYAAYNLNENVGGYAADAFPSDAYPHGLTVLQATGSSDPASSGAAAALPSAATTAAATAPTALQTGALPVGVASTPHQVTSKTAVNPAADDGETTRGYTPAQIQHRLGLTGDGTGQTVAISIAYDYPTAKDDLNHFSAHFDLPQTCDADGADPADCFDFQVVYADGTAPAVDANWNQEAALDIEWVHSAAPHAKIVLVEAEDASAAALYRAIDKAASLHPAAINNSWGMPEFSEESFYDKHCAITTVCTQSTGDDGYPAGYSSTNPAILAVGGTKLTLDADGNTTAESAWTSTGGGLSYFEKRPAYQNGVVSSAYRGTPDVSFVADPNTGVATYVTVGGSHYWMQVGGTSLSSPIWAGILAATDQLRVADGKAAFAAADAKGTIKGDTIHPAVYALGDALSDVTSGANGACGTECTAGPGYDTVTGLGSPLAGIDAALAKK